MNNSFDSVSSNKVTFKTSTLLSLYSSYVLTPDTRIEDLTRCATSLLGRTVNTIELYDPNIKAQIRQTIEHLFPLTRTLNTYNLNYENIVWWNNYATNVMNSDTVSWEIEQ